MNGIYESLNIPGSFPQEGSSGVNVNNNALDDIDHIPATKIIEDEAESKFIDKQIISRKTRAQQNLITQLDAMVYLLTGYQFIKYCHSACLIPAILHIVVQKLLSCEAIVENESSTFLRVIMEVFSRDDSETQEREEEIVKRFVSYTCLMVYMKAIFTLAYHILFLTTWELSVAKTGKIAALENGTWWFISFIGEDTPHNINDLPGNMDKIAHLGAMGLIISDFLILLIQIVLFQCIFKQSTVAKIDRTISEEEIYVVRTFNDNSGLVDNECLKEEVPLILTVRLYETWNFDS